MKNIKYIFVILLGIIYFNNLVFAQSDEECTIGVASGKVTEDGRPLIWKSRDNSSAPNNELVYNTSFDIPFLEIVTAGNTYAWMGVNKSGFAILNSLAEDLTRESDGFSNGSLMREALGICSTAAEFDALLESTNSTGRQTRGNFAVIDKNGNALLYEIGGTQFWKYDANDSLQNSEGYIVRTNFALNGDGSNGSGYERFNRTSDLINSFAEGDSLSYKSILRYQMRDFSDFDSDPVNVPFADTWIDGRPYGYIYTGKSICRSSTVSATVIQGIMSGESEKLTTIWTILGQPAATIAVPYWPVGTTPNYTNGNLTAPLCDISLQIREQLFDYTENGNYIDSYKLLDGEGGGLWTETFPVEDDIISNAEAKLDEWRMGGFSDSELLEKENEYAQQAFEALNYIYSNLTDVEKDKNIAYQFKLNQNYPNPFNPSTKIDFSIPSASVVLLKIYNMLGKEVATLVNGQFSKGKHSVIWNISDKNISSGVYFYRIWVKENGNYADTKKLIILK